MPTKKGSNVFLLILQNFPEYLSTEHLRMTFVSCVYLRILRSLSEHLFYTALMGNCLLHVQVAEFQPPDTLLCLIEAGEVMKLQIFGNTLPPSSNSHPAHFKKS